MSDTPLLATEITPTYVASQLALHGITLPEADLAQTTQHVQLIMTHADRVMSWPLPEAVEPAPEFRP